MRHSSGSDGGGSGGGGGGSGGDAAAAGRRRQWSLFRQPFGVGSTKVRVGQVGLVSAGPGAPGEQLKKTGAEPELERRRSFDSPGKRSQGPAAVTFPSVRGGHGGGGGGGGGEGGAAGRPLARVEEPTDGSLRDELPDELQPPRSPSYGMPRVTLHRRSRSEPPRDLTAVRVAAVTVLQGNSPAE